MRDHLTATALLFALAGCGGGGDTAKHSNMSRWQTTESRLESMPEGQRNGVFIRAIRDAGQSCQHVDASARAGENQGFPVWSARCSDGGSWTIVITSDGTAAVLNPNETRLAGDNETTPQNAQ
jgi:hypothetical protein